MQRFRWQIAQFFEKRWWQQYLKNKSPQEYLTWKRSYWLNFLRQLDLTTASIEDAVMDIGCGPAGVFIVLEGKKVCALDPLLPSYENLDIFAQSNYPNTSFVASSFEDFETSRRYKTVFCLNAINHFIDLKGSFQKIRNITAQDGSVVVSIDAHNHSFFRYLFRFLPLDILHPHQYNLAAYKAFLENAGFTIEKEVQMKKEFFFTYWVLLAKAK